MEFSWITSNVYECRGHYFAVILPKYHDTGDTETIHQKIQKKTFELAAILVLSTPVLAYIKL